MTIDPQIEERYEAAVASYHVAARALSAATEARAFAQALFYFPGTVTLHVEGQVGDEGNIIVRAQKVTDAAGNTIAGYDDGGMSDDESWDDFTDLVDPDLDWLGELNGDDWLGDQEITAPTQDRAR